MTPPTNIDGSQVSGVTIDGTDVQEITVDGDTVFTAAPSSLPDSNDLHSRYDATQLNQSDGDTGFSWPDIASSYDLKYRGDPEYVANEQNGNAVVRYVPTDQDGHDRGYNLGEPNHLFLVLRVRDTDATGKGVEYMTGGNSENDHRGFAIQFGSEWEVRSDGSNLKGGSSDTNWHVVNIHCDGASSYFRIDGAEVDSGSLSGSTDGISLGYLGWTNDNEAAVDFGEVVQYDVSKTSTEGDIEAYLANKWGINI